MASDDPNPFLTKRDDDAIKEWKTLQTDREHDDTKLRKPS